MKFLNARAADTPTRNSCVRRPSSLQSQRSNWWTGGSEIMKAFYGRYLTLRALKVPLVAAINGPAIGAGLCISLFADVRVAAKDAKMGFTFVNLGLHPVGTSDGVRASAAPP